jgi:hypothetical protein
MTHTEQAVKGNTPWTRRNATLLKGAFIPQHDCGVCHKAILDVAMIFCEPEMIQHRFTLHEQRISIQLWLFGSRFTRSFVPSKPL